ncbi:iron complex transport system ATP-binding protein [Aminobacter niigataensis]|uniref:Iron complex transport system ATP-binding protein n=1 Tax=Aminobacter niigataensis TaxID=83265 RepID=A0ABR6L3G0_9HYPH|nr:ABC transporter ATP-binding protein [Aminobacter niigataensis]MBB4651350.1 iron complex transport system ATP-binding protein [Aminobacter niigataensis]
MLLDVQNLKASLGRRPVLHGVSFSVMPGEFIGLIGPNGAGKSTLLRALLGLIPAEGAVALGTLDATHASARERAFHMAYVAQEREIAWAVPVEMLVSLGRSPHRPGFSALTAADRAAIERAMRRMEVDGFRERAATELSGGEKARVLIARALAQETPLLLADEPTAGLDPSHQIALMRLFAELAASERSVVASLHDLGLAARWCTRLLLIDGGRIVADGPPAEVLTAQTLRAVYGVEAFFGETTGRLVVQPLDLVAATGVRR